mgnify:CR=1 FL=1
MSTKSNRAERSEKSMYGEHNKTQSQEFQFLSQFTKLGRACMLWYNSMMVEIMILIALVFIDLSNIVKEQLYLNIYIQ